VKLASQKVKSGKKFFCLLVIVEIHVDG